MTNVAFIFEDSRFGGPHAQSIATINGLKKINFKLLISSHNSQVFKKKLKKEKIAYEEKNIQSLSLNFNSLLRYIYFFFRDFFTIYYFLKNNNISIVHIPGGLYFFKTALAAKFAKKRILWHFHDEKTNFILKCIFYFIKNNIDYYLFASYSSLKYYKNYLPNRINSNVIQSSINDKFFKLKKKKSSKIIILTVSNINPTKDIETIILTAKKLDKLKKKISFIVLGQVWNSQKNYFRKISKIIDHNKISNIKIINKFSDPERLYSSSSIYLCSSLNESSPMSVWEAMASGLPVISTPCGDIKYFLKNNFSGFIVKKKDYTSIAEKIIHLINNNSICDKFSKNAKIIARREFLGKKNIPSIGEIYNEINK